MPTLKQIMAQLAAKDEYIVYAYDHEFFVVIKRAHSGLIVTKNRHVYQIKNGRIETAHPSNLRTRAVKLLTEQFYIADLFECNNMILHWYSM